MKGNYLFYLIETRENLLRVRVQIEWPQMTPVIATDGIQLFLHRRYADTIMHEI
jgi:hypothetical protein